MLPLHGDKRVEVVGIGFQPWKRSGSDSILVGLLTLRFTIMTSLSGAIQVAGQALFSSSAYKAHNLGELVFTNDGRAFRYTKAGGTTLVPGKLQQASAEVTGDQNLTAVAAAIGDVSIASTSTVTVTANQYAEGWAIITVTPGQGYQYKIKGHAAYSAAAPTLALEDAILVALTTSSRIDLVANPYSAVIVNPATASSTPVGVAVYPVVNAEFGWVQVSGVATILADGTITVGTAVDASNGTAGAVEAHPEAGVQAPVGIAVTGGATTEYVAIKIDLI